MVPLPGRLPREARHMKRLLAVAALALCAGCEEHSPPPSPAPTARSTSALAARDPVAAPFVAFENWLAADRRGARAAPPRGKPARGGPPGHDAPPSPGAQRPPEAVVA